MLPARNKSETPRKGRFSWPTLPAALGLLAFLAAWLVPNHYPPWVSFHGESLMFLALVALTAARLGSAATLHWDRALYAVILLLAVVWLQWAAGLIAYHGDAAVSSLYLAGFGLAWWLGGNTASANAEGQADPLPWFASLLVAAAALSVGIAVLQWLGSANDVLGVFAAEKEPWGRPFGNLAQPNHLATLLVMATVMTLLLRQRRLLRAWQAWVLLLWLALGLTMAESRAGWLAALAVGALLIWRERPAWGLAGRRTVYAWWLVLLAMAWLWQPLNQALLLSATRPIGTIVQDSGRALMWRQMWAGIEQSPWWGYGWRQTIVGQKAGAALVPGNQPTDYAHSLILDLTLWLGLPLALLLLACMAWWLLRAVRGIRSPEQLLCLAATVPVAVHSLAEFPFAYSYFLFPTAWLLGRVSELQSGRAARLDPQGSRAHRRRAAAALGLFALVCAWAAAEYWQAEDDHRVMRFELRNVGQRPQDYQVPHLLLLDQLGEMLQLARETPHPGMTAVELERMRIASDSLSWATMEMRYAVALGLNGQPEAATRRLRSLRDLYGETAYKQARQLFTELKEQRYPQLDAVQLP